MGDLKCYELEHFSSSAMKDQSYIYSQLHAGSIASVLTEFYHLPSNIDCRFYVLGLHDNYLITHWNKKYILRLYRNDWRSQNEILFELEFLTYLANQNAPVAAPLPTKTGECYFIINSPEGKRFAVLFPYAVGTAPGQDITPSISRRLGEAVAIIHHQSHGFISSHSRIPLDLPYLLDDSIDAIQPFIETKEMKYLTRLKKELSEGINTLSHYFPHPVICTGDVNATNFHIQDNKITLFDFDQCGYGQRAFEIGKFFSSIQSLKNKREILEAFVNGYQKISPLNEQEIASISLYKKIAIIWVMAIHVYNVDRIGYKWLEKAFWDRKFSLLKNME